MFEPVPVSDVSCPGYSALAGYARSTSAISDEADQVWEAASQVLRERQGSESLFGTKALALSRLTAAVGALFIDGDQESVTSETFENAEQLVLALPDDLPTPEFGVDPDGAVSLNWVIARTRMFSVSVTDSERIAFAWLDGSDKGHGVVRFRPPVLPTAFASALRGVIASDALIFRAA